MKNSLRFCAVAAGLALTGLALAPALRADELDKKVVVTFSQPVEIPGNRVLPAGTYSFREAPGDPNVVMITGDEGKTPFGMLLVQPTFSVDVPDKVKFHFEERKNGAAPVLKSWTYPGSQYGFEFMSP